MKTIFKIRYEDWTLDEISADTMIETEDEIVFGDLELGILKRIRKTDVWIVVEIRTIYPN